MKSPTTDTARADGAQTANAVPRTPSSSRTCAPSRSQSSLVTALADQVQVELADRREEAVRVVGGDRPVAVVDVVAVGQRQLRALQAALEDPAGVGELQLDRLPALRHDGHRAGGGTERAHDDGLVAVGMGAQVGMGLRVLACEQAVGVGHVWVISDHVARKRATPGGPAPATRLGNVG